MTPVKPPTYSHRTDKKNIDNRDLIEVVVQADVEEIGELMRRGRFGRVADVGDFCGEWRGPSVVSPWTYYCG